MGYDAFQSLFSAMGMFSIDSDDAKTTKFDIGVPHTTAIEDFKKKSKEAAITVATGYRFLVRVNGNNQKDAEFFKDVAKSVNLKELSEK